MSEPSSFATVRELLRSRLWLGAAAAFVALGLSGGALPGTHLLEVPGFELGLAAALATALVLGPSFGIAAVRIEAARAGAGSPAVLRPFAASAVALAALLALLLTTSSVRAALATPCRPLASVPLFTLVALPSALLAASLGVGAGIVARGRRLRATLLYFALALASLSGTLLAAHSGPAASAHDHLFSFWPGPLYDEAIPVDRRLVLFRAGTLAWTAMVLSAAALV